MFVCRVYICGEKVIDVTKSISNDQNNRVGRNDIK